MMQAELRILSRLSSYVYVCSLVQAERAEKNSWTRGGIGTFWRVLGSQPAACLTASLRTDAQCVEILFEVEFLFIKNLLLKFNPKNLRDSHKKI